MGQLDDRLKEIRERALAKAKQSNSNSEINENRITYDEAHKERMNPILVNQLRERNHTLGVHPAFPDSDESHFEEKIMSKRFNDVLKNYKRQFDTESADPIDAVKNMMPIISDCMKIEENHKEALQELAISMIRK